MLGYSDFAMVETEEHLPELAEINSTFTDKMINGETCYISMLGGASYPRGEFFWVGNESLNVYANNNQVIGTINDSFASSYDGFMELLDANQ